MNPSVEQFRSCHYRYTGFASKLKPLIEDLLAQEEIKYNSVESRAKSIESFQEKIGRPGKGYSDPIVEMPDLVGVRIVLYYSDDIEKSAKLIRTEFDVIEEELSHQPEHLSADQFGYLSMHIIVRLSERRSQLPEWRNFSGIKFEVQLRTVLQHSWAAISHALQYKREGDVPHNLRRKLHRLAGIFELADEQFIELRDLSIATKSEAIKAVARGENLRIDAASLRAFVNEWTYLKECLATLEASGINRGHTQEEWAEIDSLRDGDQIGEIVEHCERLGIKTIGELRNVLDFPPGEYFKNIAEDGWGMNPEFVLYLLLIGAYPDRFSAKLLANENGWDRKIAKRVVDAAIRAKVT